MSRLDAALANDWELEEAALWGDMEAQGELRSRELEELDRLERERINNEMMREELPDLSESQNSDNDISEESAKLCLGIRHIALKDQASEIEMRSYENQKCEKCEVIGLELLCPGDRSVDASYLVERGIISPFKENSPKDFDPLICPVCWDISVMYIG